MWSPDPTVTWIVMPIPTLIAVLVVVKSIEWHRASKWVEGSARITSSRIRAKRRRRADAQQDVENVARVAYEFQVGDRTIQGHRIGIGELPVQGAASAAKQYRVGAIVPVYYDPADPTRCVLDRSMPVSPGCLWTGTAMLFAAGVATTVFISGAGELDDWLTRRFTGLRHPLMAACTVGMALFCFAMWFAMRRTANRAATWPIVPGKVVSSGVEIERDSSDTGSKRVLYRARIEYAYEVDGHRYRGTRVRFGVDLRSGSRERAEAQARRHPVDQEVDVRCDPADPTNAVLEPGVKGAPMLLVLGFGLIAVAVFVATHA